MVVKRRTPAIKSCIVCGLVKLADGFYRYRYTTNQGKSSERLDSRCMPCARAARNKLRLGLAAKEHTKRYRAANREHSLAMHRRHRAANRERLNKYLREYRARNREKVLRQRIVSEQKRQLRGYSRSRTDVARITNEALELARFWNLYMDAYSGTLIEKPVIDHIVPLSKGGDHSPENLCITSRANNSSKSASSLLHWLLRRCAN